MAVLSQRTVERPRRLTRRRPSLLTGVSLVAPVLLLAQAWGRSGIDAAAVGIGSIALSLLLVARMAGLIRQVEQQAAQLERLAQHDPLTGAANRRAWTARCRWRWTEPAGPGRRWPWRWSTLITSNVSTTARLARLTAADRPTS